ncbi:NAD-dependent dehydratase [Bordetella genomosp. 5]|uniref:NAD(P)H-binding protein n=1 Tax=Bordetella genomosp. 5 TaxID=1395608 RepID=UPI000B9E29DC|nr:NAD(P)H-binding protein [Bordetella genomosp. 5]OZI43735.1 NAD-dependent dehydratase [Bordetella genomosp. 5]
MKLLLVGATGLVGSHVLRLALADTRIDAVVAPVRRALPEHPKLDAPRIDYDHLPATAAWWRADAVICTLGTTIKKAGSQAAFRRVDHDYALEVARHAHDAGTPVYALNSAMGADPDSRFFYNRVKGELEADLARVGFRSLTYVRPGLIGGDRQEPRLGERLGLAVLGALGPVLPRRYRINPAERIAAALLDAAVSPRPGVHVVGSDRLV